MQAKQEATHKLCLFLVRHAQRRDKVDHVWAASSDRPYDSPITDVVGHAQAQKVGHHIQRRILEESLGPVKIICSPALRCVETAHIIAETIDRTVRGGTRPEVQVENGLYERQGALRRDVINYLKGKKRK